MVNELHIHNNGRPGTMTMEVDAVFAWNTRFEVIVATEEEYDYFFALQLMYGRELELKTWAEWKSEYDESPRMQRKRPLPLTFTTFKMDFTELR